MNYDCFCRATLRAITPEIRHKEESAISASVMLPVASLIVPIT